MKKGLEEGQGPRGGPCEKRGLKEGEIEKKLEPAVEKRIQKVSVTRREGREERAEEEK